MSNTFHSWSELGQLLGLNFTNPALSRAVCPFCHQGRVTFYVDLTGGGKRFASSCCGRSGDLRELVSLIKGVPVSGVMAFINQHSPSLAKDIELAEHQLDNYQQRRTKLQTIWDGAMTLSKAVNSNGLHNLLEAIGLDFNHLNGWHADNLDEQFKFISRDTLLSLLRAMKMSTDKSALPPTEQATCFIVSRNFFVPGHFAGLTLFSAKKVMGKWKLQHTLLLADKSQNNPGYLIHPGVAVSGKSIVLVPDLKWFLRSSFWICNRGDKPSPFVTYFDAADLKTLSTQMLQQRELIIWTPSLTAKTLRAASRLNCLITHLGVADGRFNRQSLNRLNARMAVESLRGQALTWQSDLSLFARSAQREELVELILAAELSPSDLEQAKNHLDEGTREYLNGLKRDAIPAQQVSGSFGLVEQQPSGWYLHHRGTTEQICSKPWRIVAAVVGGDEPMYEIEFYENGTWTGGTAPQRRMHKKPLDTLTELSMDLSLTPFTASPKWQQWLMHIALQMHPVAKKQQHRVQLGLDQANRKIRFTKGEVDTLSGEFAAPLVGNSQQQCLPQADGELPGQNAMREITSHKPTMHVFSALVLQILKSIHGGKQLAITFCDQYQVLFCRLMENLAIGDTFTDLEASATLYSQAKINSRLTVDKPLAALLPVKATHWLAGVRPVIYLGSHCSPKLVSGPLALQRTFQHLLSISIRRSIEENPTEAVQNAWRELYKLSGLKASFQPPQCAPIRPIDALGYWTGSAIRSGLFELKLGRPGKFGPKQIVLHKSSVYLHRGAINEFISSFGFQPWDMVTHMQSYVGCEEFISQKRQSNLDITCFHSSLLSPDVVQILRAAPRVRSTTKKAS